MAAIIDREMLWRQFGAAIDMFGSALRDCPPELWEKRMWPDQPGQFVAQGFPAFWSVSYHTLFWLDLYLTGAEEGFLPPEPFDLTEMEPDGVLPRVYAKDELLGYLEICRQRCKDTIMGMTDEQARRMCSFGWGELPFAELMLYNLRHVQEHAAQLHLFLGQQAGTPNQWAKQANE
jgi:hypothetical protein